MGILDSSGEVSLTQAGRKEHNVEVGKKLLLVRIEMSQARDHVSRQTDADHLQHGAKHEHNKVPERRMGIMLAL